MGDHSDRWEAVYVAARQAGADDAEARRYASEAFPEQGVAAAGGDRACDPTIRGLAAYAAGVQGPVYVHGEDGQPIGMYVPTGTWWWEQQPDISVVLGNDRDDVVSAWKHDHVGLDGQVP